MNKATIVHQVREVHRTNQASSSYKKKYLLTHTHTPQIPGTPILVDAFRQYHKPAVGEREDAIFFLSHFHGDHYGGLDRNWWEEQGGAGDAHTHTHTYTNTKEEDEGVDIDTDTDAQEAMTRPYTYIEPTKYTQTHTHTHRKGMIYCSEITARLAINILGVNPMYVCALPMDEEMVVYVSQEAAAASVPVSACVSMSVSVTLLNAHHCHGACMLLFKVTTTTTTPPSSTHTHTHTPTKAPTHPHTKYYLHTGDMRYDPSMQTHPLLQKLHKKIDTIILDTTYGHPRNDFVGQKEAVEKVGALVVERLREEGWVSGGMGGERDAHTYTHKDIDTAGGGEGGREKTLFLLSAYKLGKERLLLHVSQRTGLPIYVDEVIQHTHTYTYKHTHKHSYKY
jgi:hypothetical protein